MSPYPLLSSVDLLLRGGVISLLLLIAALFLRDYRRVLAARLGAAFAIGAAAFVLCSSTGFHAQFGWFTTIILAIATANNVIFWLFARALFDDAFRLRPWHLALWLGVIVMALGCPVVPTALPAARGLAAALLTFQSVAFALLAAGQVLATWRNDLVEPRRRLRTFIVTAAALHIVASAIAGIATGGPPSLTVGLWQTGFTLMIASIVAWSLLQASAETKLFVTAESVTTPQPVTTPDDAMPPPILDAEDVPLVAALGQLMTIDRIYRQEGLTIGQLAQRLEVREYRLRQVINGGLGYRNFSSYLNGYRIADAKAALADPRQVEVPILTIALDAGFSSLGPFNRAFKAETGLTPSEFRRLTSGLVANPGIGRSISDSASRLSKTA